MNNPSHATAFDAGRRIAAGVFHEVAVAAKSLLDTRPDTAGTGIVVLDDATGEVIEMDWRGSSAEFLARLSRTAPPEPRPSAGTQAPAEPTRGPGRPRLGVVAREVTLLPRHWEWLGEQPGGASVALRRLVDVARHSSENQDRVRRSRNAGYRAMSVLAAHEPCFDEASRALFAGDAQAFSAQTTRWPVDVRAYLLKLLADGFTAADPYEN